MTLSENTNGVSKMSSEKENVLYILEKHVGRIILNNPENGNVVNESNLLLISEYVERANLDNDCRVIVIEGKDKVFCKGMDFKNLLNKSKKITDDFSFPYKETIKKIRNSLKPVIAKVNGEVLAGGMGIMLACDIIIASADSTFGLSEVLFGIIPAYVFPLLTERIPFKKARYFILSSKKINSGEALRTGIIDDSCDESGIDKLEKNYIKRLLYSSPDALKLVKTYSVRISDNQIDKKLDIAQKQLTDLLKDEKNINAIKNFIDGNKPEWAVKYK
jgi:polyketide biosynthesis enoyl-CoA hydratase PksH